MDELSVSNKLALGAPLRPAKRAALGGDETPDQPEHDIFHEVDRWLNDGNSLRLVAALEAREERDAGKKPRQHKAKAAAGKCVRWRRCSCDRCVEKVLCFCICWIFFESHARLFQPFNFFFLQLFF